MLLAGCGTFEGTYSPNCAAYEGDRITLKNGRFVWDRFTDAYPVDEAGYPVDPTPGYPIEGSYVGPGGILSFETDAGDSLDTMYISWLDERYYLLTEEHSRELDDTGEVPECALVKGGFEGAR